MSILDRLFARVYDRVLAPSEKRGLTDIRRDLLADLSGTVVEVGAGTGLNLAHYPPAVERVIACEPEAAMAARLRERAAADPRVEVIEAPAEALPLPDGGADHAVVTLVLCSVGNLEAAATELARVVRPGGTVALFEHVAADTDGLATAQRVIEPAWKVIARGCHLTRHPADVLAAAGFDVSGLAPAEMPGAAALVRTAVGGHLVRLG